MNIDTSLLVRLLLALGAAFVISFASTPAVKAFAQKVGAIDVPNEARRVHDRSASCARMCAMASAT